MDIRSIIDSEDVPATRKLSVSAPTKPDQQASPARFPNLQASAYDNRREVRPPQPSPLQTPAYNDSYFPAASPHDNIRSPYQHTPSFGSNNGQYPPPQIPHQSPHHGQPVSQYPQRDNTLASGPQSGRSFGHSTPLSQTPTASTPGSASAYSSFQRPTSSHSIPTPNSAYNSSGFPRESPQPSLSQSRAFGQLQGPPHYVGQPGTPLGPPTTHRRPSLSSHRQSSGEYRHQRSFSGGHHGQQDFVGPPGPTGGSPSANREQQSSIQAHIGSREREKSLSVSPKTRLPSLPSISGQQSVEGSSDFDSGQREEVTAAKRKPGVDTSPFEGSREPLSTRTLSRSVGLSGLLNAEPPRESPEGVYHPSQTKSPPSSRDEDDVSFVDHNILRQPFQPHSISPSDRMSQQSHATSTQHSLAPPQYPTPVLSNHMSPGSARQLPPQPETTSSFKMAALKTSNSLIDASLPTLKKASRGPKKAKRPMQDSSEIEVVEDSPTMPLQPAKKKPRFEEAQSPITLVSGQKEELSAQPRTRKVPRISSWQDVPIYAQSVRGPQRTMELFQQNLTRTNRGPPIATPALHAAASRLVNQPNGTSRAHIQAPSQSSTVNGIPASTIQQLPPSEGPLGPWESNVIDTIPADEVTRIVADFLFPNVVLNSDVGVAPAGGGRGLGAVLEIEAKIGRLIDRNTNDRLQLPVMNECVISHADPNMRIAFESSMTEHQHRNLNQFLNKALVDSQGPKQGSAPPRKPRIPMTYKHTKEIDTFYEISQQGALQLPRSVASGLQLNPNARHKARVRITTNEKTGEELAKIVKTRVADIDVYSPRTLFDWRISVNVEMDFDIDMKDLVALEKRDGKADRRKDRVSYKHLQYQIDLTQVTPAEPANKTDKEHELEIEVSSEEIRKQGLLVMHNQPNGYEDLVKGFVDNVRLLARHCKE